VTHDDDMRHTSAWGHLFSGAVAGAASRTATAPLETLRLAVMTGSLKAGCLSEVCEGGCPGGRQGWGGRPVAAATLTGFMAAHVRCFLPENLPRVSP
jgi:hypothetical protein